MKKEYKQEPENPENVVKETAIEYGIQNATTYLPIDSIEDIIKKLAKSEEDLANGIYTTHENMKKKHL
ncbi:MAG: hypothetical protein LUE98_20860 [Tannerellaceae bacterium]|nr:hypothetical protein [Tannerellaceae bacterium]